MCSVVTGLGPQLLRLHSGFEGWEVRGSESRGPALPAVLVDFWDHFRRGAARSKGLLQPLELCVGRPPHVGWHPCSPSGWLRRTEEDGQRESCCTRSLLSRLGWYMLASASYKGGATAMAFGQVQGGMRGAPPLPQALTHLKEAEQQGHSTDVEKGCPRVSRMVVLTRVSAGPPPAPQGQHRHPPSLPHEEL